ncbi:hypothetical protein D3C87_1235180 [compost metagenome]
MLQHPVAQRVAVLIVELLEVVDVQHHQRDTSGAFVQRLLQQPRERCAVEQFGQAVECRGQLGAFEFVTQGLDFVLRRLQLAEELLLLTLHQPSALLQLIENARQAIADRLVEHFQALPETVLEVLAALHAARNVTFHTIHQADDLLLLGAGIFKLVTDDVLAKKPGRRLWRATVEVPDNPVQMTIEFRVLAFAVGVPQRVMHRIGRNIMANHQWNGLLEQRRSLAGVFRIKR